LSAPAVSAPSPERPPRLGPRLQSVLPFAVRRPAPDVTFTIAVALLLSAIALEGGGGLSLGPTTTVEIGLQLGGGLLGAAALLFGGAKRLHGGVTLALFAVLTGVTIASIGWAVQPADAWLEGARTLSYLAAFGGGLALVRLAPERWASLLTAVLLATVVVSGYALATKIFPASLAAGETYARLRDPFGYWNAVGLMAALGVPGCLWLGARRSGHSAVNALAYPVLGLLLVVVLLAYSRGSLLAVGIGIVFWFAVVPLRLRGMAVLLPSLIGAGLVSTWAFAQDSLSKDQVPIDVRTSGGQELGLAVLMLLLVLLAVGLGINFAAARQAPSATARRRAGIAALIGVALLPIGVATKLTLSDRGLGGSISHSWTQLTDPDATTPANDPGRLTAVGSVRARYYDQSIQIFKAREIYGAGAGGFATARARFRTDGYEVRHAHGYLFQTAADLGLLGLLASLLLTGAWMTAAARTTGLTRRRWRREPFDPERVGLLTLTTVVVIFGVHSLVDWTWFVPGTCVTALLCAAWVAGRGDHRVPAVGAPAGASAGAPDASLAQRLRAGSRRPVPLLAASAVMIVALSFAWATWQPLRSVSAGNDALELVGQRKTDAARDAALRAADLNPLSIEPLFDLNIVETQAGREAEAREALERAVRLQPQNATPWLVLAEADLKAGKPQQALKELGAALYLDPRSTQGVTLFLEASRQVGRTGVMPATPPTTPPGTATP
jgi:tetratricopeptide (TPR) repeat protein